MDPDDLEERSHMFQPFPRVGPDLGEITAQASQ